jgi:hypothetical protein
MGKQLDILEVVNRSGFPFQMDVTDFVKRGKQDHHCRVLFTEHSWKDSVGEYSGFIDLVVASDIFPYVFVIDVSGILTAYGYSLRRKVQSRDVGTPNSL